ncbi:22491_t:CDS:1, partial [Gigaspora margarita]
FFLQKNYFGQYKEESVEKQIVVNILEDSNNGCRVIFAVNKLNKG